MSDNNAMEDGCCRIWKRNRKALRASGVEKEPLRVGFDPSLSTPDLLCRFLYSTFEPSPPVEFLIVSSRIGTVFVGKNDDVVFEHDEEIANFLAYFCCWSIQLVTVDSSITPE